MGTRSDIIVHMTDGRWGRFYCHWDGYLEHNGRILFDHYTSQAAAEALIALGDLSALGETVGKKHPFDGPPITKKQAYERYQARYGRMCKAYGRDRGETGTEAFFGASLAEAWPEPETWTEFTYVWTDGRWFVADPDEGTQTLIDLGDALTGARKLTPAVKAFGATIGQHAPHDPKNPDEHGWHWKAS